MLLKIDHINKSYAHEKVLNNILLELEENKTLSILGKSGCGKTTLLKIIAGLLVADEGKIFLRDKDISDWQPQQRSIVYLSQETLLFPHLNVFENIAFGLRIRKETESTIKFEVVKLANELGLSEQLHKMPDNISGGQKQRVNFGRAIIIKPPLLLLDEPFSNLDTQTRTEMQELFKQITGKHNISAVFVTHDLKEALLMGDRIGFMQQGKLKTYSDKISFITDSNTGVEKEIAFWKSL